MPLQEVNGMDIVLEGEGREREVEHDIFGGQLNKRVLIAQIECIS